MFIETTATKKICALTKRIRFVSGGTSSSKTISILLWLIDYAQSHKSKLISVVSESLPHLKKGAIRDFQLIMESHNYWDENRFNKTDSIYTFETGSKIEFFSADEAGKVHGPRRDILYLNEANNIDFAIYTQLEIRTREIIWVDSNPTHEYWMYTEVIPHNDIDFITLTYKDNEALEAAIVQSIESKKHNTQFWQVYGLGQLGEAQGRIYKGWDIIDSIPHQARLERFGLDFGYTNDPTAIVAIYRYNGGFIFDEIAYRTGLSNRQIADIIKNQDYALVVADSAEPKSIDELRDEFDIDIVPCTKGPGSINQGIQYVQDQKISVTKSSTNLIKEYRNYLWLTDKNGKTLNIPQDTMNHCMDAVRYSLMSYAPDPERAVTSPRTYQRVYDTI